jgi:hypothetical protein
MNQNQVWKIYFTLSIMGMTAAALICLLIKLGYIK